MYKLQLAISVTDSVLMNLLSVSLYVSLPIPPSGSLSLILSFTLFSHSPALLIFPLSPSPLFLTPPTPVTYTGTGCLGNTWCEEQKMYPEGGTTIRGKLQKSKCPQHCAVADCVPT